MAVIVNSHDPIYEESNSDKVSHWLPNVSQAYFCFPSTAHLNPSSYCMQWQLRSPAADCLYCISISVYPYIHPSITPLDMINLDTLPLVDTMPMMHPHEGKRNNVDVQLSKKRCTTKDSYRRFDKDCTHAQKTLIQSYATLYIAHLDKNKGKCRKGFMQELVEWTAKVAGVLEIKRNDIYNKVRRVNKELKAAANENVHATVSPGMSESFAMKNASVVTAMVSSNEVSSSPSLSSLTSIPSHEEAAILSGTSKRESGNPPPQASLQLISPFSPAQAGESLVTLPLWVTLRLTPPYLNKTWVDGQKNSPMPTSRRTS